MAVYCVGPGFGVPLNYVATANSVSAIGARVDAAMGGSIIDAQMAIHAQVAAPSVKTLG